MGSQHLRKLVLDRSIRGCGMRAPRCGASCITLIVTLRMAPRRPRGFSGGNFLTSLKRCYRMSMTCHDLKRIPRNRRNDGPKGVKILVTNLTEASAGAILSMYAWRWGVELTIKELKSGLHLGQMQVTKEAERVRRSVVLAVLASLLLLRLDGRDEALMQDWSLFKRKERFIGEVAQDAVWRTERQWQRKWTQFKDVA